MIQICPICKEPFEKTRPNKQYCCENHRKRAESRRRYPKNKDTITNQKEFNFYIRVFDLKMFIENF